ncbi:MAG: hypothetical protein V3U76_07440 [Granulosicoccus sp.]
MSKIIQAGTALFELILRSTVSLSRLNESRSKYSRIALVGFVVILSACSSSQNDNNTNPVNAEAPLVSADDFTYIGGFTLPGTEYGETSMNYATGVMEQFGNSLFIVGHAHHDMIAEFTIPELVNSKLISDLNSAGNPLQFAPVLNRSDGGNLQNIDQITGLEHIDGQMIVNGIEYYDAPADNTSTTLIVADAFNLASTAITGYLELSGAAKAAGWISRVPSEWRGPLGGEYLTGSSSGGPFISRHSVGPSAFILQKSSVLNASVAEPAIDTTKLLEFTVENPLHTDLLNDSRDNDLWTHTDSAVYGFIVPDSRTYATFGYSTGHKAGVGSGITQDDGTECIGFCSYESLDVANYYWFWDMNDLLAVKNGEMEAFSVRPYAYGEFPLPFQTSITYNQMGGATYDSATRTLYFSVLTADNTRGEYENPPVIAAFSVSGLNN